MNLDKAFNILAEARDVNAATQEKFEERITDAMWYVLRDPSVPERDAAEAMRGLSIPVRLLVRLGREVGG